MACCYRKSSGEACVPSRWTFAAMGFLSVTFTYILRVDINLALVGMVNHTALDILAAESAYGNRDRRQPTWPPPPAPQRVGNATTDPDDGLTSTPAAAAAVILSVAGGNAVERLTGTICVPGSFDDLFPLTATGDDDPFAQQNASFADDGDGDNYVRDGPFVWEETTQTVVMSSFFVGYLWTQLFGGNVAERLGGKGVIAFGLLSAAVLHFLLPLCASTHLYLVVLQRILSGLSLGFIVPTINMMVSKWCPPSERSRMNTLVHSGAVFGTLVAMPLTGLILDFLGWQAVFYIIGTFSLVLFFAWLNLVHESPGLHPTISRAELKSIEDAIGMQRGKEKLAVPWRDMLRSRPLWALVLSVFCVSWGFSIVISLLPMYLHNILRFSVYENGFISALPYVCQFLASWPVSILADYLRRKGHVSTTTLRKICQTIANGGAGLMMMCIARAGCNRTAVIYILAGHGLFQGFTLSAYSANMLDIAPNFTGTITGTALIGYSVVSIIAPITAGAIISGQETLERWSVIFYVSAACFWASAVIFALLASGEEQPWNRGGSAIKKKDPLDPTSATPLLWDDKSGKCSPSSTADSEDWLTSPSSNSPCYSESGGVGKSATPVGRGELGVGRYGSTGCHVIPLGHPKLTP